MPPREHASHQPAVYPIPLPPAGGINTKELCVNLSLLTMAPKKRVLAFGTVALAAVSLTTGLSSLAIFTDTQTNTGSAFVTGTIDIAVTPSATAFFDVPNMMPGDDVTRFVTVENNGTSQLRWSVESTSTTGTGGLMNQIDFQIGEMNSTACASWDGSSPDSSGTLASIEWLDQVLDSADSVGVCFRAALPLSTGDAFQDTDADTSFTFSAEQTANNPA